MQAHCSTCSGLILKRPGAVWQPEPGPCVGSVEHWRGVITGVLPGMSSLRRVHQSFFLTECMEARKVQNCLILPS